MIWEQTLAGEVGALLALAVLMAGFTLSGRWFEVPRAAVAGSVGLGLFIMLIWVAGTL